MMPTAYRVADKSRRDLNLGTFMREVLQRKEFLELNLHWRRIHSVSVVWMKMNVILERFVMTNVTPYLVQVLVFNLVITNV